MTSENFRRNAVSTTYRVGLVIHSAKPLRNCTTSATHTTANRRLSEVKEIVSNSPSSRRLMMKRRPTTIAVPSTWIVTTIGHPQKDSRTQAANGVFSNDPSTAQSSPHLLCVSERYRF